MAVYRISGVWKQDGAITHYAFHTKTEKSYTRATKISKVDAIKLLANSANSAKTWMWDYVNFRWKDGADVEVVDGKYLRSDPDAKTTDNLVHLINCDWFMV